MNRKSITILLLAFLLIFSLAACGGEKSADGGSDDTASAKAVATEVKKADDSAKTTDSDNAKSDKSDDAAKAEEATATPEPTTAPEPTDTPEPEQEGDVFQNLVKIEDVANSFHSHIVYTYDVSTDPPDEEEDKHAEVIIDGDWVKADNIYGFNSSETIKGFDMPEMEDAQNEKIDEMQMINLDDTSYIKIGDQWITMPRDESDDSSVQGIDLRDVIYNVNNLKKVGKEKVNGIKAIHYQFTEEDNFDDDFYRAIMEEIDDEEEYVPESNKVQIDVWIAEKEKYAVKAQQHIESVLKSKTGDKTLKIVGDSLAEITNINGDIVIEPPEGAPKPGEANVPGFEPGTFPIPEQTTVNSSLGGMINLTSQLSVDEVTAFYNEKLAEMGWTKEGDMMPTWTKDGKSFMLMVTPNDDNTTEIMIIAGMEQ